MEIIKKKSTNNLKSLENELEKILNVVNKLKKDIDYQKKNKEKHTLVATHLKQQLATKRKYYQQIEGKLVLFFSFKIYTYKLFSHLDQIEVLNPAKRLKR